MTTIKDAHENSPSPEPSSTPARPLQRLKTAEEFAAIRERLAAVAAELRQMARDSAQPDNLINVAGKLEAMAAEENKP